MEEMAPLFALNLFGYEYQVTSALFIQWVVIAIALVLSILYSRKVKRIPGKIQSVVEMGIEFLSNVVKDNMGPGSSAFIPYIGSLGIYLFLLNMVGLFGIKPPTSDYSVTLGIALTTFFVIQGYT
ncbi:MAG TPA: F0F1 ATP synthase subunit A, partial [Clostridium sp.]|nr:F0F1 ATP synthase subunit A [Clostridium sp.]